LSADIHPLNNYDINYIGSGFQLPLTGGGGISIALILSGSMFVTFGFVAIGTLKMRKVQADGYTETRPKTRFKKLR
jgi:hypothetical protein